MKRLNVLALISMMLMLMVSCDRGSSNIIGGEENPSLILNSLAVQEVEAEGGVVEIRYTLNNPVSGAQIEVTHPDWVTDYNVASEIITLDVSANADSSSREGVVKVSYQTKSFEVTLFQHGVKSEGPEVVDFQAEVLTGEYYGEYYTIGYGNYYIYFSDNGFDEGGNFIPNSVYYRLDLFAPLREGEFTGEVQIPDGVYELDATNAKRVGTFTADNSGYITSGDGHHDLKSFSSGRLVVEGDSYTLDVVVDGVAHCVTFNGQAHITDKTNEIAPPEYSEVEIAAHWGVYYGERYSPGMGNYYLVLSPDGWQENGDELPSGRYYRFDLYAPLYEGAATGPVAIPEGEYTLDLTSSCGAYTIAYGNYTAYTELNDTATGYVDEQLLMGCKLIVSASGITVEVLFGNQRHTLTYDYAPVRLEDYSDPTGGGGGGSSDALSNLQSDLAVELNDHMVMYCGYGDYYGNGTTNWTMLVAPNSYVGHNVQFDLLTSGSQTDNFLGEFSCSTILSAYTFQPGDISDSYLVGSWYYRTDESGALVDYAPLVGGTLSIVSNGDGTTTIEFECYDDLGNCIEGSWTGDEFVEA